MSQRIIPNIWANDNAQQMVDYYLKVFPDGQIIHTDYYAGYGQEVHGHAEGELLTIEFEIHGTRLVIINGGSAFSLTPAISLMIECQDQAEIDYYWQKLSAVPEAEACGWCQDKFGLSWQIAPVRLNQMLAEGTPTQRTNVTKAFMDMKKFNLAELEQAYQA